MSLAFAKRIQRSSMSSPRRGRPGITRSDVEAAVAALLLQRRTPGPVNIRLELGSGSYSTILRFLRDISSSSPAKKEVTPNHD
jgi:hypothetical protein